jgi:hypothetical protein
MRRSGAAVPHLVKMADMPPNHPDWLAADRMADMPADSTKEHNVFNPSFAKKARLSISPYP